jgi:hypothetical protein
VEAGLTLSLPLVPLAPLHPPEAEQELALEEDQERVELPPAFILEGLADMETVGAVYVQPWFTLAFGL